jgi:hypothetical protein
MSVDCRMPETALDSAARGVAFKLSSRIISAIPGTFRSMTASVASGVTSRGERPVPPEVTTSRKSSSLARRSRDSIALRSSGKISIEATSNPASVKIRLASGPERSSRFPAAAVSLIVRTNARPSIQFHNIRSGEPSVRFSHHSFPGVAKDQSKCPSPLLCTYRTA